MLYRPGGSTWAFTEARPDTIERSADLFALSGSRVERTPGALVIHLDERTAPWGRAMRGRVRVELEDGVPAAIALDRAREHHWWPAGAKARAEVELECPAVRFRGSAYHDCNFGSVPLEDTFTSWNWSRTDLGDDVCIVYDVQEPGDAESHLGLRIGPSGVRPLWAEDRAELPRGFWGVERSTRSEGEASLVRTLEDTPFYTRSLLRTTFNGRSALTMHESLSLTRFVQPWVQFLLPFRLRRGARA